jgi:hypothetical protein
MNYNQQNIKAVSGGLTNKMSTLTINQYINKTKRKFVIARKDSQAPLLLSLKQHWDPGLQKVLL